MQEVLCLYDNEYRSEYAYDIHDFNYHLKYEVITDKSKNEYISIPITFDIETSTIKDEYKSIKEDRDIYEGFMYHWQACVYGNVVFGRTWHELIEFFNKLKETFSLNKKRKLVCYVHNLSYEFQFMYRFFDTTEVFATDNHKVLRCVFDDCIEMCCSYYLSNMSLAKFIENTSNTHHNKGQGDLDYRKVYTPKDELTLKEKGLSLIHI